MPDFGPAEQRKPDVPAQTQAIAVCNHGAAIGLARFRIVKRTVFGVSRVDGLEMATNTQAAQRVLAEFGIRIVYVILIWPRRGYLHQCRAEEVPAVFDTDDGVICRRPVADHVRGNIGTASNEEQNG
jgi:hypothetical protein